MPNLKLPSFKVISAGLLIISLLLLFNYNSLNSPFERDEGEYAYAAWAWDHGQIPYTNIFVQKPPMIIYIYKIAQLINPNEIWPVRIIGLIATGITVACIGLIAKKLWGKTYAVIACIIGIPMLFTPYFTPFAANTEKFMLVPLMVLTTLYFYYNNKTPKYIWFIVGGLSALAVFTKPICILVIVFIVLYWLIENYNLTKSKFDLTQSFGIYFIGGLFASLIIFLPFIPNHLSAAFETIIKFNLIYSQSSGFTVDNLWMYLGKLIPIWWPIFILWTVVFLFRPIKWWWFGVTIITSLITIYTSPMGHYYISLIPFAALLATYGLTIVIQLINPAQKYLWSFVLTGIIFVVMIIPFLNQFTLATNDFSIWIYGTVNPFVESKIVAQKVQAMTTQSDYVYVAGSEPQINFYAKRLIPTRFDLTYQFNLESPYREEFQTSAVTDLINNPPKAIVLSQRQHSGLWNEGSPRIFIDYLYKTLNESYVLKGGYVWQDNQGAWYDTISKDQLSLASFLVYQHE